jgi:sulfur-oxidizing protein SoxX
MAGSIRSPRKCSVEIARALTTLVVVALAGGALGQPPASPEPPERALRPYTVAGDAIPEPLTGIPGDAARGRAIVANRQVGLCLLCHTGPYPEERFQGTLAPDLKGTGARWSAGQLRLRMVDASRFNPDTIMPPYYRIDGLERVAPAFRGKPILTAEQIEDVVAHLATLQE